MIEALNSAPIHVRFAMANPLLSAAVGREDIGNLVPQIEALTDERDGCVAHNQSLQKELRATQESLHALERRYTLLCRGRVYLLARKEKFNSF